jgi:putative endonuclease
MGLARSRGKAGEALAVAFIELLGWPLVARNPRLNGVEVDLVALDGATRVVIEVKCRTRPDYGGAALAVDETKRRRLLRAARALLDEQRQPVRIDVVAIDLDESGARVRHYRGAVAE